MLEFGSSSNSGGSSSNVIVQKVKIVKFDVTYGQKRDWQNFADDIGIDLVLDIGQDFQPNMYIGGSFTTDEMNGDIVGWGRAYKVKMFFDAIGLPIRLAKGTVVADNKLPANASDQIVGKEFLRLSYLSTKLKSDGKNRWKDWQDTIKVGEESTLKEQFASAVSKGYVKDFQAPGETLDNFDSQPSELEEDLPL